MQYFYHQSIKNYTIALLDLFSDIHIPRYSKTGELLEDIIVPIKFGSKEKAYELSKNDLENIHNGNVNMLPRMALSFESMNKAQERDTNKLHKINKNKIGTDPASLMYEYHFNGVAYDFNFVLYIATRTFTDATIIIEQIAPMFRPDLTMKIQELDIQDKPTSIPVSISDFGITLPEETGEDEIRIIEVDLPLILKGNLYLPIKNIGVIDGVKVNMEIIEAKRSDAAEKFELDYPSEVNVPASSFLSSTPEELYPTVEDEIPQAQEDATTIITHSDNAKPNGE